MNPRIQIIAILGSLIIVLLVFWLIRRRKLREEYSFLWFGASIGMIVTSIWRESLEVLADLTGVYYPPSILLLGGIIFGFLLAVHYSVSLSRLEEQNKRLAQELALLRHDISCAIDRSDRAQMSSPQTSAQTTAEPRRGEVANI